MSVVGEQDPAAGEGPTFPIGLEGRAWRVIRGELDVFVARGGPEGGERWRPLLSIGEGTLLPAVPYGRWGHEAFGRPAPGAVVEPVATSTLTAGDAPALDRGLSALLGALHDELPPRDFIALTPGETARLDAGAVARPVVPVAWLDVREGELRLRGRMGSRGVGPGAELAIGEGDWLVAETAAVAGLRPTVELIAGGGLPEALEGLSHEAARIVEQRLARAEEAEGDHAGARDGRDHELAATTARAFGALLRQEDAPPSDLVGATPVLAAARVAASAQGIELRRPVGLDRDAPPEAVLRAAAHVSRVHLRPIALERRWHTQDLGPLVGLRGDGAAPVALVRRRGGYELRDPATGDRRRVSAAVAAEIAPTAYGFHRTLPDRPVRLRDMAAFGLRGLRGDLVTFFVAAAVVAGIGLLTPVVTGSVLGTLIPDGEAGLVAALCVMLIVAAIVAGLIGAIQNLSALRAEGRAAAAVQGAVWARVMALPAAFHRERSTGALATSALAVIVAQETLSAVALRAVLAVVVIVANLALITVYDLALAAYAAGVVALAAVVTALVMRRQLALQRRGFEQLKTLNSRSFQLIDRAGKLRAAAAEERAFAHWADAFLRTRRTTLEARTGQTRFVAFTAALAILAVAGAFVVAGSLVPVDPATFLAFNVAFAQVSVSVILVVTTIVAAAAVIPMLESLRPIVSATPEVVAVKSDPGELSGEIEVTGVSFRYHADSPQVLEDVSVRAAPGEFVALVGPSGCGKSTLLRILLGFEAPDEGAVLYDGQDLGGLDAAAVRRQCGVVLQDGKLIAGDIYGNVAGSGLFGERDVWAALEMAGMAEDVEAMPMNLATLVSPSGGTLSGGQVQRLMIARAVIARPRILFLDEATSALDNRTQEVVAESTRRLAATRIVIAHRLSTIRAADRIVVMDAGRVVQEGSYDELMATGGVFRTLATRQLA